MTDATHDPARGSYVPGANGHAAFPIQNLPLGIFSTHGTAPRPGIAIGDMIFDVVAARAEGLLEGLDVGETLSGATLNAFLARGAGPRRALRARVSDLLSAEATPAARAAVLRALRDAAGCAMHLPCAIGDYTDFFAGIHHAVNAGKNFRPDNPLLPNYKYVPIAYHGRASSIRPSGAAVRRPRGQRKPANAEVPTFGPSRNLDYELELGLWIGPGNALGDPVPIGQAGAHIAGVCLLNDWSARDIQGWEYQPLGPFLAKNFCSTISPWIITPEALAPFRIPQPPRPEGDPAPLPYLWDAADQASGALDIGLEVYLLTPRMRAENRPPHRLSLGNARHLYWTPAQMVAHHSSGGCDLRPGDLFGSGTISTPEEAGFGSLLELTQAGRRPITLESGETRRFLEDGDEVIFRARASRPGAVSIGLGECRGTIVPAHEGDV